MSYEDPNRYQESISANNDTPLTLLERLNCVRQLVFSRTRLEARLLWNKIFQKEDEELGWLLNPYKESWTNKDQESNFTLLTTFSRNTKSNRQDNSHDGGYQSRRFALDERPANGKEAKTFGEKAIQVARYMGMGVYMTSTAFPSPMVPFNDTNLYDETVYSPQNVYTMSKIW